MTAEQIRRLYAKAHKLGIVENGNKNDNYHILITSLTGKMSTKDLSVDEYKRVDNELTRLINSTGLNLAKDKNTSNKKHQRSPGGISAGQINKIWALMYQLASASPALIGADGKSASIGSRLCGVIKKEMKLDATTKSPLAWMTYKQGNNLIEIIKKYILSTERKKA